MQTENQQQASAPEQQINTNLIPPQPPVRYPGPSTPPTNNKSIVLWLVIGLGALVTIGLMLFIFVVMPFMMKANAYDTADNFFKYSLDNDTRKLETLYDDASARDFIETAATKVDKSCKIDRSSFENLSSDPLVARIEGNCNKGVKDWTFELTRPKNTSRWVITKIVYNSTGTTTSSVDRAQEPSPTLKKVESLVCLAPSDAAYFSTVTPINVYQYFHEDSFFFNADATSYQYPDQARENLAGFAEFYKKNSNKDFSYSLKGSVNEGAQSAAGRVLAQQRADIIKAELVSRGVPLDRIVVDEPISVTNTAIIEASRNVTLTVKAGKNCSGEAAPSVSGR